MVSEDLLHLVRRDRGAVEQARATHWREVALNAGTAALLAIADGLRRHVQARFPGWPDETERAADLANHIRVSRALSHVRTPDPA